eukprot:10249004-Alexandrium_andersonii.AAC.1
MEAIAAEVSGDRGELRHSGGMANRGHGCLAGGSKTTVKTPAAKNCEQGTGRAPPGDGRPIGS